MIAGIAEAMMLALGATDTPATSPTAKAAKLDKVVCHEEQVVGSRFPCRVCASKRSEPIKAQEDQEVVRHMQDMTPLISH